MLNARLSDVMMFARDETVILDYIISNIGNGYNIMTGIFTVP